MFYYDICILIIQNVIILTTLPVTLACPLPFPADHLPFHNYPPFVFCVSNECVELFTEP